MSLQKPSIDLRLLIEIIDSFNSIVGLLLNSLLFYLIIRKTNFRMLGYRPILIQNCLIDVLYTFSEFITKPQIDYKDGSFFIMCSGFFSNISYPWNSIFVHLWCFSLFYCLTSISVQYIFRYFMIVKEKKLKLFQYFGILSIPTFLATLYTVTNFFVFSYKKETHQFHVQQLMNDSYYYHGIPNFVVANIESIELQLQFAFAFILVNISYVIIFYTNLKIYKKLLLMKNKISSNNFQFQRQLTFTLFAQTIVPSITCMIPIGFSVIMTVSKANIPGLAQCVTLLLSCLPIANPLTTIIVISSYRDACISFFKNHFILKQKNSSVSNLSDLNQNINIQIIP